MNQKIESLRTLDERFAFLPYFPYAPNYVDPLLGFADLRMHFVDEGPKDAQDPLGIANRQTQGHPSEWRRT